MMYVTIALFALAAVLGLTILSKWLGQKTVSRAVVYSHGLAAALGLVLLLVYSFQHPDQYPLASVVLFVLAALGGFYLFYNDQVKQNRPVPVAFLHALLALSGFVTLLLFVFD